MTLADQIDADLEAVFFTEGGLGVVSAVYRSADGSDARNLRGIYDDAYIEIGSDFGSMAASRPVFHAPARYFPDTFQVSVGDTLEIERDRQTVTVYTVKEIEPDGYGHTVLLTLQGP